MLQKGNVLLVVLLIAAVTLGVGGFYFYSKNGSKTNLIPAALNQPGGLLNLGGNTQNSVTQNSATETGDTTSDKMYLTIESPKNGDIINSKSVTLKGKTTANADVFINDQQTKADANGNFSITLNLDEGANDIVVTANDNEGNVVEQDLSVNIQTF